MDKERILEIKQQLQTLDSQKQKLLTELKTLESINQANQSLYLGTKAFFKNPESPGEKIELFLKLFRCRKDIFPRYWENQRSGKKGYSPVCTNEWKKHICYKPNTKCTDCPNKAFVPFDENIARAHLTGKMSIGSYAINTQDRCTFLVADFDKSTWKEDVVAYKEAAENLHIQVSIEISKSGNGAHAWIFFESPVSARKARKLGDILLTNAMDNIKTFNLDSYDRFFPNQDCLPAGGFGNLIALPLQKTYRDQNRSVFVDDNFDCTNRNRKNSDVLNLLEKQKAPLILSDRINHIDTLAELLIKRTDSPIFILKGGLGKKERQEIIENCTELFRQSTPFCLFATGSLIGEGFDFPDFDTMVLTLPISFKGRLTQYVGRLHRQSTNEKKDISVYDYVDTCSGMTISMFKKRIPTYRSLGYSFHYDLTSKIAKWI